MNEDLLNNPSSVDDSLIAWASQLLKLPPGAFYGDTGTDPRQYILKSMDTVDVAACPGSGKTTLLVAKLAIVAEKWNHRTRGICALSHTNVARNEIGTRLSNTAVGRRLLSYPHYVGTIHAFVNEFLAIPWLRCKGYPIKLIDNELCECRRWRKLPKGARIALEKKNLGESDIRISDANFNVAKKNGALPFSNHTFTYTQLKKACEETAKEGYHCYDDMFLWAHDMMDALPEIIDITRNRFPLLFQSAILHRLFRSQGCPVIRQRFGDTNQAIFDSMGSNEAKTDKFADNTIKKDLPNSHRFGQKIADFADPLGLVPYGLKGHGPKKKFLASGATEGEHTVFLFDEETAKQVLDEYGELLLRTFSEQELQEGIFTAVGQIHRPPLTAGGLERFPQHVGDYWPDYDPELASRDPRPETFVQYVAAGMARAETAGEAHFCVDKVAEGILHLCGMAQEPKGFAHRRNPHRHIIKLLQGSVAVKEAYNDLILTCAERRAGLTEKSWSERWRAAVREIAQAIAESPLTSPEATEFLNWGQESSTAEVPLSGKAQSDNTYRYCRDGKQANIRVGSIHSVKGETHTATLVLETFWYKHNLEALLPWLTGDESGKPAKNAARQELRLKTHYVAMTRPTHLLCLAMKRTTVKDDEGKVDNKILDKLENRGWAIRTI